MSSDLTRKIEQAKQQLEHMIDLNPQIMLLADNNKKILRANKALVKYLSVSDFGELLGSSIEEVFCCDDSTFFDNLLSGESGCMEQETQVEVPSAGARTLKFTVIGSGNQADLFALIVEDVTEERKDDESKAKEHKIKAVEELTGALLHNVNQPLTVILMRAQLMQLQMDAGPVKEGEFRRSLDDIIRFTLEIAEMLKGVEKPQNYVTSQYSRDVDIFDIKQSSGTADTRDMAKALMLALDAHMPGDWLHAKRTAEYAAIIASEMKLGDQEIAGIRRCAHLHDVGKLGVPVSILKKTTPLTEEETSIIRRHSDTGHNMLHKLSVFETEASVAYCHHERYDGSGYPRGIEGEETSLFARIVAVADTFDALMSDRPYRKAVSFSAAVKEISAGSGSHFDPDVIDAFRNCSVRMDKLFK